MKDSHTQFRVKVYTEKEISNHKIKVRSSVIPFARPSFEEWCRELHVSRLHGREDCWLENNFFKENTNKF